MIDWTRIATLRDEIGDDDIEEVVEIFLEEVEETLDDLPAAASVDELERGFHALKGSALNLGFQDFSVMCQTGEHAAANGQNDAVCLNELSACYTASKTIFLQGYRHNQIAS